MTHPNTNKITNCGELCAWEHHVRSCCCRQIPLPTARPPCCPGKHTALLPDLDPGTALSPTPKLSLLRAALLQHPRRGGHSKQLPAAGCGHAKGKGTFLPLAMPSWVNPAPPGLCTAPALDCSTGRCSDQRPADSNKEQRPVMGSRADHCSQSWS